MHLAANCKYKRSEHVRVAGAEGKGRGEGNFQLSSKVSSFPMMSVVVVFLALCMLISVKTVQTSLSRLLKTAGEWTNRDGVIFVCANVCLSFLPITWPSNEHYNCR